MSDGNSPDEPDHEDVVPSLPPWLSALTARTQSAATAPSVVYLNGVT
jgi:hypothetical protein